MGDLMDGSAYRLYFAHSFPQSNGLILRAKETIHTAANGLDLDGNRRGAPDCLHKSLVILNIP